MRLSAIEKRGEETLEMAVHCRERGKEASAAFALQTTDGTAQAVDGLPQFVALGAAPGLFAFKSGSFLRRDEVDWTNAFPVLRQLFESLRFMRGFADRSEERRVGKECV